MNEKWERNWRENIVASFMLHLCICQVSNSIKLVGEVKGKAKVKFTLEQATKTRRGLEV